MREFWARGSSAGPWGWISGVPILCWLFLRLCQVSPVLCYAASGLSFQSQSAGSPHWNAFMFHYFAKDSPARTTSSVFEPIPWVETQSHVVLPVSLRFFFLQCLGDKTSNLKFASILSAAFPIHMQRLQEPRAKMPLCSVTAQPGAVRRSNNVNKRVDEEQKINKPAIVPVRIAATRKLKNYTWHMLPGCTQHCCSLRNRGHQVQRKPRFAKKISIYKKWWGYKSVVFFSASLRLHIYFYGLKLNSKKSHYCVHLILERWPTLKLKKVFLKLHYTQRTTSSTVCYFKR